MPYWRLYYHIVWATFERHPLITVERGAIIRATLSAKAKELRVVLHATGIVADHMHVVASIPPVLSLAVCVKHLKGASSRAVHLRAGTGRAFRWQEGYGALTLGERSLRTVVAYVQDQPRRHREQTTLPLFETTERPEQSSSEDFGSP
jgi:REP-associated tyrosine transposase